MKSITKSIVAFAATAVITATAITATVAAAMTDQESVASAEATTAIYYDIYATGSLGHKIGRQSNSKIWVPIDKNITLCDITNDDINNYTESFALVYGEAKASGRKSELKSFMGFEQKYKWTGVTVVGANGISSTVYSNPSTGNYTTVSATANDVGKIKRATYYSFRNVDTTDYSNFLERSIIGVKNPAYY